MLIGRVLNAQAVGLYNVAYNLASIPNTLLLGVLQPTFLATGARLQDDPDRLAQGWLLALSCVLVLITPAAVVLALLSTDLVHLLYGAEWAESGWVLGLLLLCVPAWTGYGISTPLLWNTGRKHLEYLLQLPLLALALPAWWLAAPYGIRAIAAVSAAVIFARTAVIIFALMRALQLRWAVLAAPLARGLALAAACAAAVLAGKHLVAGITVPAVAIAAGSAGALGVLLLVIGAWPHLLGAEIRAVLARFLPFVRAEAGPPLAATRC
jgi:O-antigen/teichoic acid export membrane protein